MRTAAAAFLALAFALPATARGMGSSQVAALQVALSAKGLYAGTIDGVSGPETAAAVRRFQKQVGLPPDGVAGLRTRQKLGRHGVPELGGRELRLGTAG